MSDVDERAAALLSSPLGCAFLIMADAAGLSPWKIAEPVISLYMAAYAAWETSVWRPDYHKLLLEVLERGLEHAHLAWAIMEEPAAAWWFSPMDRDQQVWISRDGTPPDPAMMITPDRPPSRWERYAQKTAKGLYTSTLMQGTSSFFVALDERVGDIGIGWSGPPFASWRLRVDASARILEIDGPQAWHDLCVRYPAEGESNHTTPDFSGDEGRLVPDWSAVAGDWDAVHLTFGGWLTAEQARVESPAGWTYHWGWDAEQTLWLRWKFTASERMPDHEPLSQPLRYRSLNYLRRL